MNASHARDKAQEDYKLLVLQGLGFEAGNGTSSGMDFQEDGVGNAAWQAAKASRQQM